MPVPLILLPLIAHTAPSQTRVEDVVYLKSGGAAFTMDVIKPAKPNKAAVVFMVSGGWVSDHSMVKTFGAQIEKAFGDAGFTVFSVVHGAQPRYKVGEIIEQVRTAARFVRTHAADYGVEANRIGVTGVSSGGHLSLMIGGATDFPVDAVVAIAPPTDLANWGKPSLVFTDVPVLAQFVPALGLDPKAADFVSSLQKLSPVSLARPKFPPTLIVHGDNDTLVPLQQGQLMDQALAKAGVEHGLEVVKGGGHDEKTFVVGVAKALAWFKEKLAR